MKTFLNIFIILLFPSFALADAGPNIGRPKAPCYAIFMGIDKLTDYEFFKVYDGSENYTEYFTKPEFRVNNNDTLQISFTSRRDKDRVNPIKILVRNKMTQEFVDSFTLVADGYNLIINFTGAENDKVKYTIDKTESEYPYQLFSGDATSDVSLAKRNKYILISLSVIGFLLLLFMFAKRKGNSTDKNVTA